MKNNSEINIVEKNGKIMIDHRNKDCSYLLNKEPQQKKKRKP